MIFQRLSHFLSFIFYFSKESDLAPYSLGFVKGGAKSRFSLGYSVKTLLKSQTRLVPIWSSYLGVFPAGIHMPLPL